MTVLTKATAVSRRKRFWILAGIVVLVSLSFVTYKNLTTSDSPSRAITLEKEVKCPTCIDLSIYNSNDATSYTMRVFIRKAIAGGESNSEILDTLVTTYGSEILMTPPKSGINLLLWFLPASFLVAAILEVFRLRGSVSQKRKLSLSTSIPYNASVADVGAVAGSYPGGPSLSERASKLVKSARDQGKRSLLLLGSVAFLLAGGGILGYGLLAGSTNSGPSSTTVDQQVLDAEVLAGAGQYDAASQILAKVLQTDPTQPQALAYQGWISFQVGSLRKDGALESKGMNLLKVSISLSPSYAMGHVFYAVALYDGRHDAKASVEQFRIAIKDHIQRSILLQIKPTLDAAFSSEGLRPPL